MAAISPRNSFNHYRLIASPDGAWNAPYEKLPWLPSLPDISATIPGFGAVSPDLMGGAVISIERLSDPNVNKKPCLGPAAAIAKDNFFWEGVPASRAL
jgi:hypothetical protein